MNRVVVHLQNGKILKGQTHDFLPMKDRFHLVPDEGDSRQKPLEILMNEMKALFFVKDLEGDSGRVDKNEFDPSKPEPGRKVRVLFKDGEVMTGTTQAYQPGRPGLFMVPADKESNNERCYVVIAATQEVKLL